MPFFDYKQGNTVLEGYWSYDERVTNKRPGVLVVHEFKGLDHYAQMRADMLAQLGYVALAVDIFGKGVRPQTTEEALAITGQLRNDRPLLRARIKAGLDALKANLKVDASKTAAIGFCFGGTTVLELARSGADVKGVVSFHGGLNNPNPQDAKNIKAKVLVLNGALDPHVKPEDIAAFETEMKAAQVDYQLIQYPGAEHGFTNPENKNSRPGVNYNGAADKASWQAMQEFFKQIFVSQ